MNSIPKRQKKSTAGVHILKAMRMLDGRAYLGFSTGVGW
jgi:hypothetical protein